MARRRAIDGAPRKPAMSVLPRLLLAIEHDFISVERIGKSTGTRYWEEGALDARLGDRAVTRE